MQRVISGRHRRPGRARAENGRGEVTEDEASVASEPALEARLEALHDRSVGWALACSGWDRDEASDLLQIVYVKVLEGRARFEARSRFSTWLFGVIRVTASERRRKRLRRRLLLRENLAAHVASVRADEGISIESARLRSALSELPRRQREVLHLVFYSDLSIREASEVMGVALGTARVHYERGKKRLRERLEEG